MDIGIKVKNLVKLQKAMDRLPAEMMGKVYGPGLMAAAKVALARVKQRAPVRTGRLRDGWYAKVTDGYYETIWGGSKTRIPDSKVVLTHDLRYPFIVEYMYEPYLRPAVAETADEQLAAFRSVASTEFEHMVNGQRV